MRAVRLLVAAEKQRFGDCCFVAADERRFVVVRFCRIAVGCEVPVLAVKHQRAADALALAERRDRF